MNKKIGLLIPYSGEFVDLKRILLNPFAQYAHDNDYELLKEFIGPGSEKEVNKAIDKLFYQEDVDIIIGYVGYRVAITLFDKLRRNPDKIFIHLSLGEVIPYTQSRINYPDNYLLFSSDAWKTIAFLGAWVARKFPAADCMICTSLYDAGYSLVESFRVGYHSIYAKPIQVCTLNNNPNVNDVIGLFNEINRLRPGHLHVTLCGRELDLFINQFSQFIDYTPSVSFSFPVSLKYIETKHAAFKNVFTAVLESTIPKYIADFSESPFSVLFQYLTQQVIKWLDGDEIPSGNAISIVEMNLIERQFISADVTGQLPVSLNAEFNHSAENAVAIWQNPYLCI
ncbi:hypothetical protein [Pedobacter jeongneungensis]|uniref:hypothetical protein n=1 Tax=Pedobacter jeongneungensis TaxID=947309 RepID=UPI0004685AA6|nr:hypothetical protein [Pedobacter jeongneungensis]